MATPSGTKIDNKQKILEKMGTEDGQCYIFVETIGDNLYEYEESGEKGLVTVSENSAFTRTVAYGAHTNGGRRCLAFDGQRWIFLMKDTEFYCSGYSTVQTDNYTDNKTINPKDFLAKRFVNATPNNSPYFSDNDKNYNSLSTNIYANIFMPQQAWSSSNKWNVHGIYGEDKAFWFGFPNTQGATYTFPNRNQRTTYTPTENSSGFWNWHIRKSGTYGMQVPNDDYTVIGNVDNWDKSKTEVFQKIANKSLFDVIRFKNAFYPLPNIRKPDGTYYHIVNPTNIGDELDGALWGGRANVVGYNILCCASVDDGLDYLNNGTIHDTDYYFDLENEEKIDAVVETPSTDDPDNEENGDKKGTSDNTPYTRNSENILGNLNSRYYICDKSQVNKIVTGLWQGLNWGQSFFNDFTGLYSNLSDLVIKLHWLPIPYTSGNFGLLGDITTRVGAFDLLTDKDDDTSTFRTPYLINYPSRTDGKWTEPERIASFDIKGRYNSYLDFAPWTNMTLFLPFVGFVGIDTNMFMEENKTTKLNIEMRVDVITGDLTYFIKKANTIVQIETGNCMIEIPVSIKQQKSFEQSIADAYTNAVMGNATNVVSSLKTSGAKKGTQVPKEFGGALGEQLANVGADFVNGLDFQQPQPVIKGNASATSQLYTMGYVALYVTSPLYNRPKDYEKKFGYPSNHQCKLSEAIGYNEVNSPQIRKWTKVMTDDEINEIYSILSNGFIVRSE